MLRWRRTQSEFWRQVARAARMSLHEDGMIVTELQRLDENAMDVLMKCYISCSPIGGWIVLCRCRFLPLSFT